MTEFSTFGLAETLTLAAAGAGLIQPTPIQTQAIPHVLAGRDLIGIAQTGTGKTASFMLPMLHRLLTDETAPTPHTCRALVLVPTRELAAQICEAARTFGRRTRLRAALLVGGVPRQKQNKALGAGIDIAIATPGRLLDHLSAGTLELSRTTMFVLDEADHMLDLGFIDDVLRIAALLPDPRETKRQTLLFSATMPPAIEALGRRLLHNPLTVAAAPPATAATAVDQRIVFAETQQKRPMLIEMLKRGRMKRTLVFTRTRQGADLLVTALDRAGLRASAIHGDKSQPQRDRVLAEFRAGTFSILVATDVAARGIDIAELSHVVNLEIPDVPETYIHRIGRTARAGQRGIAISFCAASERSALRDIEKLLGTRIRVYEPRQATG